MSDLNVYADQLNADQLSVETPEQVDLRFPVAGVGSRCLAILLDSLIQIVTLLLLYLLIYVTSTWTAIDHGMSRQSDTAQKWWVAVMILAHFLLFWGYFVLFEAFWKGQTPGKRVMKLRVLKASGRAVTLFESMARNLLRVVDLFPSVYLVGLIAMLCNRQNQRLGDLAAGTIVIHERLEDQPALAHTSRTLTSTLFAEPEAARALMPSAHSAWLTADTTLPADAVARLHPADLHVIEVFFSRALDLPIPKREELGARVAARISRKMRFTLSPEMPPERLLELVAFKMRTGT